MGQHTGIEQWRPIPGVRDLEVSTWDRVRRPGRRTDGERYSPRTVDQYGCLTVEVGGGARKSAYVPSLTRLAFPELFPPEEWRPIAKAPGYEVSDHGRVRHGSEEVRVRERGAVFLVVDGRLVKPGVRKIVRDAFGLIAEEVFIWHLTTV